jgi:hypothetical protein
LVITSLLENVGSSLAIVAIDANQDRLTADRIEGRVFSSNADDTRESLDLVRLPASMARRPPFRSSDGVVHGFD